jgi:hypothetical protein
MGLAMRKRDELINGCMAKARDDEMTFVLLGRDAAAPVAIRAWICERIRTGKNLPDDPQIIEAKECATIMEAELEVTPQFVRFLDEMAAEMGLDREDVVRLALGLLRIGLDAKREGNKLAIVTPDLEFDQEVTGF